MGASRAFAWAYRPAWLQDLATRLSRIELALAFFAAALLGGFLSTLQDLLPGKAATEVKWLALGLLCGLLTTTAAWILARSYSLDLGACLIIRAGQLRNRPAVSAALKRSSRDWIPLEIVDDLDAWSGGEPESVVALTRNLAVPLSNAVGFPRVLLALSCSDAVGFYLGSVLRPSLLGAEVQVMTLPTESQTWRSIRYSAGQRLHKDLFERDELSGTGCSCSTPRGAGVIDPLRSPDHNPEVVLASLVSQRIICCTGAVHVLRAQDRVNEPAHQSHVSEAVQFLRARSRWLISRQSEGKVSITLTVGPEVSMLAGLLLSGFCSWRVWEFDRNTSTWKTRWTSGRL